MATPTIASSTVYGRCSRSAAGWSTLARTRNPAMTKVMLATVVNCRSTLAGGNVGNDIDAACFYNLTFSQIMSFSGPGRGVRGDARAPRLDAHNHHLPSLPRWAPSLSRIASQEGESQPQGWVSGGLPASVFAVALPL